MGKRGSKKQGILWTAVGRHNIEKSWYQLGSTKATASMAMCGRREMFERRVPFVKYHLTTGYDPNLSPRY